MAFSLRLILCISFLIYLGCFAWGLFVSEEEYKQIFIKMLTSAAGLSIIVAFFALWLTLENYLRKSSLKITGNLEFYHHQTKLSAYSYDSGIQSFQLNNYKDKTVVIYKVYLRLKRNLYIEILDVSNEPILLKAYDTYFKKLKSPLYYIMNNQPRMIKNTNLSKAKLYLDTNEGKYKVKKGFKHWIPENANILIPKILDKNHDFDIKFICRDRMGLPDSDNFLIKFGQDHVEVRGKKYLLATLILLKIWKNSSKQSLLQSKAIEFGNR